MQKHVNLVDLVKSFPTNIFLQNLASIQKRTSPIKFAHLAEKSGKGSISNLSTKVGSALYGLQRLGDGPEVRELVMALTMKVRDSQEPLDAQAVGNALYGLQTLGDSPEARALVGALTLVERFDIEPFTDSSAK